MSKRMPTVWDAEPHTIAKISILKSYLNAWFRILGKSRKGQRILYVDGFAGPGHYKNHTEGSPLAALRAAQSTIHELDRSYVAGPIHTAFIECNPDRYKMLSESIAPYEGRPSIGIIKKCCEFTQGIEEIKKELPGPFRGEGPLFVFADPFGGTGIPFSTFADCIQGDTAELLINLDADGIARIFVAQNNNRDKQLTELFGGEYWKDALTNLRDIKALSVQILDLYKTRLKTLPDVKYVWSFAMRGKNDSINYHLVFATKHPLGLEKMKEAMRAIDKTGFYSFSDAHCEQDLLFRDNDEDKYASALFQAFENQTISFQEAYLYALNETPFTSVKALLFILEKRGQLQVLVNYGETRRSGSFDEGKIQGLRFVQLHTIVAQPDLFG